MKLAHKLTHYQNMIEQLLREHNLTRDKIMTGRDAWAVAHKSGVTDDAYSIGRDVYDAHIQTVLEKIFPNAVFKDAKRY